MAWQDTYQPGFLDGARFYTVSSEMTLGRKVAIYDQPFGEGTVTSIDLGKRPLRFVLDAFFLGENYTDDRDKFLKVINKAGPKELIHPFYSRLIVIPDNDSPLVVMENPNENGGMASIKLTLIRHRAPDTSLSGVSGARLGTAAALSKAGLDLESALSTDIAEVTSLDDFVAAANLDVMDDVLNDMQSLNADIDSLLALPTNLAAQITAITGELTELLSTPAKLFSAVDGLLDAIAASFEALDPSERKSGTANTERVIASMSALGSGIEVENIPAVDTPARQQQREGKAKFLLNFRAAGLRRVTDRLANNPPDNASAARRAARKVREGLTRVLETSISGAELSAPVRRAVTKYRAAAVAHLEAQAGRLVDVQNYTPPETLPAEVIAWTLYGDARRYSDVIARAEAVHPGFIPGGVSIELLVS